MPYGVAKRLGGDNARNDSFMESCVSSVQRRGEDKVSAIRICKAAMSRRRASRKG